MKTKKPIIAWVVLCVFAFCTLPLKADNTPKWKINLSETGISKPPQMQQLESGVIVLSAPKSYCGIDPHTQAVLWKYTAIDSITPIQGTNFLQLYTMVDIVPRIILINTLTGKEILDTKDENIRFESLFVLNEINALLIEATNGKKKRKYLYNIDLSNEEIRWAKDIGEGMGNIKNFFATVGTGVSANKDILIDGEKHIVFATDKKVFRINSETGDVFWETTLKEKVKRIRIIRDEKRLFIGYLVQNIMDVINLSDGTLLFPKPLKIRGELLDVAPYKDKALVTSSMSLNIFNFQTLVFEWEKQPTLGAVSRFRILNNGVLTINETQPDYSYVYFVDMTGKIVWHHYLDKLIAYDIHEQGIFYVTKKAANIMSLTDGKNIWNPGVSFRFNKTYFNYNAETQQLALLAMSANMLSAKIYTFSMRTLEYKVLTNDIVFGDEAGAKKYVHIDETDNGYAVYTDQNLILVNKEGAITHNRNYPLVGGFATVTVKGEGFLGMLEDVLFGKKTEVVYFRGAAMEGVRQTATSATNDRLFIMTECRTPANKLYPCLLTVEKTTGQEVSNIALTDMSPVYLVDAMNQMVYLLSDTELVCYAL